MKKIVAALTVASLLAACGGSPGSGAASNGLQAFVTAPDSVASYFEARLDGSQSLAPNSPISTYAWTQTSGPAVTLSATNAAVATFRAPVVSAKTVLKFQLQITDAAGEKSSAPVTVSVVPPLAERLAADYFRLKFLQSVPQPESSHTDAVPTDDPPLIGSTAKVIATLSGAVTGVTFRIVNSNAQTLGNIELTPAGDPSAPPLTYVGTMNVPAVPFAVVATGNTADGQAFTLSTPTINPLNTTALFSPNRLKLNAGASGSAQLQIFNQGSSATFIVHFDDPGHVLAQSQDVTVTVGSAQSVSLPVTVTNPSAIPGTYAISVTARASVTGDSTRTATARLKIWPRDTP